MKKLSRILLLCMLMQVLPACNGFLKPHKMPIQQGNVVTKDMLDKLKVGMKPSQVKYVLGTPLVVDTFDNNRWFYLYNLRMPNGDKLQQKLEIIFDDGELASFNNDYQFDVQGQTGGAEKN
ncbi:MAG: outer membrane protein assembly factor BamE [Pseudomonadales bacterium]|nr:outer membrane protein assembly factor BamE [Pseudomonadales bacterium]NNM11029.1 outer membrane protein assembly factor BamE [Pseudomonadales bacterium]